MFLVKFCCQSTTIKGTTSWPNRGLDNPNEMWMKWKALFLEMCDLHAPLRTKHVRASRSPYITPELKNLMYWRDHLKIKALRTGDPSDWSNFKKLHNEVNNTIKNVKKSY